MGSKGALKIGIDGRAIYRSIDGIGRYSLNLIKGLASIDHKNQYIVFKNRDADKKIVDAPNFTEVEVDFRHLSLRSLFYLPFFLKDFKLDLFHSPFFICPIWGTGKVILTVHDLMALSFQGFFSGRNILKEKLAYLYHRLFVPLSINKAQRIIAVSENTKMALMHTLHIAPEMISVIYEAVDSNLPKNYSIAQLRSFRCRKSLPQKFLLYLGAMKPYKNIHLIISALKILKGKGALEHVLVIAGRKDRSFPSVYQEVKNKELLDDVVFLDYVSNDELFLLFKNADIFIFPSLCEGFGLPPLEAMSLGIPTIVSNISSLPEVVGNGAILVDPFNSQDLAQAILKITKDKDFRHALVKKGIERSKVFSWETTARKTLDIYNEICHK